MREECKEEEEGEKEEEGFQGRTEEEGCLWKNSRQGQDNMEEKLEEENKCSFISLVR